MRIRDSIEEDLSATERKAVECVKNNPRYFFSYAKKFSKLRSNIGPHKDGNGTLHHDPKKTAQLLQEQFSSVFSNPENTELKDTTNSLPEISSTFNSFDFNEEDIIEAIFVCSPPDFGEMFTKSTDKNRQKLFFALWRFLDAYYIDVCSFKMVC